MPTHEVGLDVNHLVTVGNGDIDIPVKADGSTLGRLRISRGGVDWKPRGKQRPYRMRWEKFAQVMEDEGKLKK